MATDLKDDATSEEIDAYVEQVVEDVKSDRAGETEQDETTEQTEVDTEQAAETDSGSATSDGEDTGERADWLDDDLKAEIAAYGLEEDELSEFTSREELERAMRFFDRSAQEAGRRAMSDSASEEPAQETSPDTEAKTPAQRSRYEINLNRDDIDESIVGEFERMRDHYESRLEAMEAHFAEAQADAEEQHFDSVVDSLGHGDLFGKTGKESRKQLERRQDLHIAVRAQMLGMQQLGRKVDLDKSLVARVARMEFSEDIAKKELKNRTRKIAKQSDKRMGGGQSRPQDPPESLEDEMVQLYKELEQSTGS